MNIATLIHTAASLHLAAGLVCFAQYAKKKRTSRKKIKSANCIGSICHAMTNLRTWLRDRLSELIEWLRWLASRI